MLTEGALTPPTGAGTESEAELRPVTSRLNCSLAEQRARSPERSDPPEPPGGDG